MMWDLGGGTYVPGSAESFAHPAYPRPPLDTYAYPSSPTEAAPFYPIGGPPPPFPSPGSIAHSYSYPSSMPPPPPMQPVTQSRSVAISEPHHSHRHRQHHHRSQPGSQVPAQTPQEPRERGILHRTESNTHSHTCTLSKCTGKKKALCIGINYIGSREELRGCINDAKNVRKFLINHQNYKSADIVMLTDDAADPRLIPTKQNMLNAMHWLVHEAHPHDALFFHYSGHGSQVKDEDGDEPDGFDEVIFSVDFRKNGVISDDIMHKLMVKPLPDGCRLTALFDSCHSGSVLDLPYLYDAKERSITRKPGLQVTESHIKAKSTFADVISWSGCKDDQTSADTYENGVATGAMSYAFMTCLRTNPHQSYHRLLRNIRAMLKDKYKQKPQLSSSHHIDISREFIM